MVSVCLSYDTNLNYVRISVTFQETSLYLANLDSQWYGEQQLSAHYLLLLAGLLSGAQLRLDLMLHLEHFEAASHAQKFKELVYMCQNLMFV